MSILKRILAIVILFLGVFSVYEVVRILQLKPFSSCIYLMWLLMIALLVQQCSRMNEQVNLLTIYK